MIQKEKKRIFLTEKLLVCRSKNILLDLQKHENKSLVAIAMLHAKQEITLVIMAYERD